MRKISNAFWAICLIFLCVDFISFTSRADKLSQNQMFPADIEAVIALTGGRNRIAKATELAKTHELPLFISGVYQDATAEDVASAAGVDPKFFECCATLGYQARTTHENAMEVAQWSNHHRYSHLIIVTSNYHMERALLEFQHEMPDIQINGYAIASPVINAGEWWNNYKSTKRMFVEWSKWRIKKIQSQFASL